MDPVSGLGPSIFLHILSYLPSDTILSVERVCKPWRDVIQTYEKSVWRLAALNLEADNPDLHVNEIARAGTSSNEVGDGQRNDPNWRKACEDALELDRNWRYGRCREHWIRTPGDAVWRFKIDEKQGTCLSTSRAGPCLHVVDTETSERLFTLEGVPTTAHLEFVAGHAIFDDGGNTFSLNIFRTSDAISASRHPSPPLGSSADSALARHSPRSFTHPEWTPHSLQPLPRGHLEFYRTITPPMPCRAFRARLDRAGTPDQRVLLATAGQSAVYIWDLEELDPMKKEVLHIESQDQIQGRIDYVEFDDDYVFLCRIETVLILSRRTKRAVYKFPDFEHVFRVFTRFDIPVAQHGKLNCRAPSKKARSSDEGRKPMRQCVELRGDVVYNDDPTFREELYDSFHNVWADLGLSSDDFPAAAFPGLPGTQYEWNCCHYTRNDLHAFGMAGVLMTIRDFRTHLAIEDEEHRRQAMADHTICTSVIYAAHLLATTDTRVVACASDEILFWSPGDLPPLPGEDSEPRQTRNQSRCQMAQLVTPHLDIVETSCLQVDHNRIYITYRSVFDKGHEQDDVPCDYPDLGELGYAIKCWDFSN